MTAVRREAMDARLRLPLTVSAVTFAATLALLPIADVPASARPGFLPAILACVMGFHLISLYLLAGDYRDRGDRRILVTCCGYLAALVLIVGYSVSLPNLVLVDAMWAEEPSVTPYLYLMWHLAFPLIVGLAWAPWPPRWKAPTDRHLRTQRLSLLLAATFLLSLLAIVLCVLLSPHWPSLSNGLGDSPLAKTTGPVVVPLLAIVLLMSWDGVKQRSGPERWVPVAVLMCLCDLVLASVENSSYTIGWYFSRTLSLLTGGILVAAMLTAFRRMKATAEYLAAFDSLTGLPNERNAHDVLRRMMARAERLRSPLSVIALKIDQYEDLHLHRGSLIADAIIAGAAERIDDTLRKGDTPARVAPSKFLVLLPDTSLNHAVHVGERLRIALACLNVRAAEQRLSASVGVATLRAEDSSILDFLQRADDALQEAELHGQNQVVMEPKAWDRDHEPEALPTTSTR